MVPNTDKCRTRVIFVEELPEEGKRDYLYLVPEKKKRKLKINGLELLGDLYVPLYETEMINVYSQYIWIYGKWEYVGMMPRDVMEDTDA